MKWTGQSGDELLAATLAGAGTVINLSGSNVSEGRWTAKRKLVLRNSRVHPTMALLNAMSRLPAAQRPLVLINTSGIDYSMHSESEAPVTEDVEPGTDFLSQVCIRWEATASQVETLGVRAVFMRMGLVIGPGFKTLQLRLLPFRLFCGGSFGSGKQWFCWVHLQDVIGLHMFAMEREDIRGPLNVVAPGVLRERETARLMGKAVGRPSWLRVPEWALRIGAGEQADLLVHGRHAVPEKALTAGYRFKQPELLGALRETLGR